jgi:hypothetical protein
MTDLTSNELMRLALLKLKGDAETCERTGRFFGDLRDSVDLVTRLVNERSAVETPANLAGLLSWGLRPTLPECELSLRFESVEAAQAARELIRERCGLLDNDPAQKTSREADVPRCNTHGTTWQDGCRGCSEAERLTEPSDTRGNES